MEDEYAEESALADGKEDADGTEAFSSDEIAAFEAADEREALASLFAAVRACSRDGRLTTPAEWADAGFVPASMSAGDFEMFVYEYLEEERARRQFEPQEREIAPVYRSASRAVGVPKPIAAPHAGQPAGEEGCEEAEGAPRSDAEPSALEAESFDAAETVGEYGVGLGIDIPEGYELVELEGELVLLPIEEEAQAQGIACDDIEVLLGRNSYYLYSSDVMTDRYARWAFLAREDDRIATFVECVREESRTYPRPLSADGLKNEPFCMNDAEIAETWRIVRESGAYPDIETTTASNGKVFYYSTEHLSAAYAASLAEWNAVERYMNL